MTRQSLAIRPPFERGVRASVHLANFLAAASPNVVIVGDSTTTVADQIVTTDYLSQQIRRKLIRENPTKTISFYERGIGGAAWSHFDAATLAATGLTLPSWASPSSNSWPSFVQALNPDLVIFVFGANTGVAANEFAAFYSVQTKMATMATALGKSIDLVFVTSEKPNKIYGALTGAQEVVDQQAALVRGYCLRTNKGLIDKNRWANIIRDSRDPVRTTFYRETINIGPPLPWTYTTTQSHDMALRFQTGPQIATGLRGGTALKVVVGSFSDNTLEFWKDAGTGNFFLTYRVTGSLTPIANLNTGVAVGGTGSETIHVEVITKGNWMQLGYSTATANPGFYTPIWSGFVERAGGVFNTGISMSGQGGQTPFINYLHLGVDTAFAPIVKDSELWGVVPSGSGGTIELIGGNGTNHLSAQGQMWLSGVLLDHEHFGPA